MGLKTCEVLYFASFAVEKSLKPNTQNLTPKIKQMKIRIGFGFDVHALKEGESLIIGGVEISHHKGTVAHSDGDVLLHAICDALLGAANLRDIGFQFPDTDEKYKNIDSSKLLEATVRLLHKNNYEVGNIDCTIAAQKPKLNPHIEQMKSKISQILNIDENDISIKATTTEKLGFEGREEGISAYASVLIQESLFNEELKIKN